uniref:Uncharacterized protein LOC117307929 n=1 Tax=Tursiops truncatus TaxID=9739 RepID=A0A6J3PWZ5_TURTR|nr:uncharacterized protein LOC117307929 [Tursiops truncatus]
MFGLRAKGLGAQRAQVPPRAEFYGPGPATAPLAPRRSSGGGRHPLAPALGRSLLGTPRERKRLPLDWKNLQRRLFACPCSASSPWRLQCAKSTLRVLAAAPRGSSWKLSEHDPPPQTGASSGPGARGRAGAARSGGFSCPRVPRPPRRSLAGLDRIVGTKRGGRTRFCTGVRGAGGVPLSSGTLELAPWVPLRTERPETFLCAEGAERSFSQGSRIPGGGAGAVTMKIHCPLGARRPGRG